MAQKLLKTTKKKVVPKKAAKRTFTAPQKIVLVGTYKDKQLKWIKENGFYNYPVKDGDEFDAKAFAKIKELWLYADTKGRRHCFTADFVKKMTQAEFVTAYPTYVKLGKSKQKDYYVFKTSFLNYGPKLDAPDVLVRVIDFATGYAKKVKKAVDAYHADGDFGSLANYLPTELSRVPRERLRVCEAAVQLNFIQRMFPECTFPATATIAYADGAIRRRHGWEVLEPPTENSMPFRLGEFFCGPGGLASGAMSASIENPNFKIAENAIEVARKIEALPVFKPELYIDDDESVTSKVGRDTIREVKQRQNQNIFRKMVLLNYGGVCCVTGMPVRAVLRASHIVGWAEDETTRLLPSNGLCLAATYDAAFDRHLISFDEDCRMIISPSLHEYLTNGAFVHAFKDYEGKRISRAVKFQPSQEFLQRHREQMP